MPKRDLNQLAASIVQQATDEDRKPAPEPSGKAKAGKLGGIKGGQKRAITLAPKRRTEIAKKAANKRWKAEVVED